MRTETVTVGAVRGDPQLRNVWGFAWNANAPGNSVSAAAAVTVEVEWADGRTTTLRLRPGVWYAAPNQMRRVWFTTGGGTALVLDWADTEGESATPSPTTVDPEAQGDLVTSWRNVGAALAMTAQLALPRNTHGLLWWCRCTTNLAVASLFGVMEYTLNGAAFRIARQIGAAGNGALNLGAWGNHPGAGDAPEAYIAAIGNAPGPPGGQALYRLNFLPAGSTFPRSVKLGVYDNGAGGVNRWDIDVLAV